MTDGYMLLALAPEGDRVLNEGLVAAASIALIAASILWVVLSRLILRNLRKSAEVPIASVKAGTDIWRDPPPPPPR